MGVGGQGTLKAPSCPTYSMSASVQPLPWVHCAVPGSVDIPQELVIQQAVCFPRILTPLSLVLKGRIKRMEGEAGLPWEDAGLRNL